VADGVRACPVCEGDGCSECDGTGEHVTTYIDAGDGITARVHGSAPLSVEARTALAALARAAYAQMRPEGETPDA
jgi:hypothetical protein